MGFAGFTADPYNERNSLVNVNGGPVMSSPIMDAELFVEFTKTGGIAGVHVELTLSEHDGTLTDEDAQELGQLLDEVDFFNVNGSGVGKPHPDGFNYTITAARGRRRRTVSIEDGGDTELLSKLGPLIAWLEDRAPSPFPDLPLT
jgi:hypothetical protein